MSNRNKYAVLPQVEVSVITFTLMFTWLFVLFSFSPTDAEKIGLMIFLTLCWLLFCFGMRGAIRTCFSHIIFSEEGIEYKPLIGKSVILTWEDCRRISIERLYTEFKVNNSYFLCFVSKHGSFKRLRELRKPPDPKKGVIIMTYVECVWDDIIRYAPRKLYADAYVQRHDIE